VRREELNLSGVGVGSQKRRPQDEIRNQGSLRTPFLRSAPPCSISIEQPTHEPRAKDPGRDRASSAKIGGSHLFLRSLAQLAALSSLEREIEL
jgi:hypothetical protein